MKRMSIDWVGLRFVVILVCTPMVACLAQDRTTSIASLVKASSDGETASLRAVAADRLYELTAATRVNQVAGADLSRLQSLLDSDDANVQYWAARSIGNFGGRATPAVPKLLETLSRVDCVRGSKTAASGIRFALKQISGLEPPHRRCYYFYEKRGSQVQAHLQSSEK